LPTIVFVPHCTTMCGQHSIFILARLIVVFITFGWLVCGIWQMWDATFQFDATNVTCCILFFKFY